MSLFFMANDDGGVDVDVCRADMAQGIFMGKTDNYIFTPRPTQISDKENEDGDITDEQKREVDDVLHYRHMMDFGKSVFFGYLGKSVAIGPKLMALMETLRPGGRLFDKKATAENTHEFKLLDPRILKTYIKTCYSPSLIEALAWKHERIGEDRRPLDGLKDKALPIGIVVVVGILLFLYSQGMIPGIGGPT